MIQYSRFNIQKLHRVFFFLLLVFLPTQLGYHTWPAWTMVLGRRVDYLSPTLYLTDLLIILVLLFWFGEVIARIMNHESGIKNLKQYMHVFMIQYSKFVIPLLVFVGFNILFAANRMVAIYAWVKCVEFLLLGVYIVKTKPPFANIIFSLAVGVVYASVLAIAQFYMQHAIGGIFWFLGERTFTSTTPGIAQIPWCLSGTVNCPLLLRAYGTFSHPNVLGGFLAVSLPLLCYVRPSENLYRILKRMALVVGVIALFFTFSRSAWIVGTIAMVITMARILNLESQITSKKHNVIYATLVFFVIILASYFMIHNSTEESVVVRIALNNAAVDIWRNYPWFGVGLGNFLVALPSFLPSRQIYFLQPVHNIYFLSLSEIGVVGVGLIAIFIFYLLNLKSRIANSIKLQNDAVMIRNSLFMILFLGLVDHYFLTLQQGQLLLTIFVALFFV